MRVCECRQWQFLAGDLVASADLASHIACFEKGFCSKNFVGHDALPE